MIELGGPKFFSLGQKTKKVEVPVSLTTHWRSSQFSVEVTLLWYPRPAFIMCQIKVCLLVAASLCYSFNCERVDEKMLKCVEFCCGYVKVQEESSKETRWGSPAIDCSIKLRKWVKLSLKS